MWYFTKRFLSVKCLYNSWYIVIKMVLWRTISVSTLVRNPIKMLYLWCIQIHKVVILRHSCIYIAVFALFITGNFPMENIFPYSYTLLCKVITSWTSAEILFRHGRWTWSQARREYGQTQSTFIQVLCFHICILTCSVLSYLWYIVTVTYKCDYLND